MTRSRQSTVLELVRYVVPVLIILLGFGIFFLLLALRARPEISDDNDDETTVVESVAVKVHKKGVKIEASGLVVPYREIEIPAEVAGRIVKKEAACRPGRYVEKGAALLEIEKEDYEIARDEAAGALLELRSEKQNSEALLKIAKKTFDVEKRDYQRETGLRGVVSRADLDQAERELLAAENSVVMLENQLALNTAKEKRLDAALRKANLDVLRSNVTSPISGVIVSEMVEQDMFVQRGTTLLAIEDTSKVEIKCSLKKEELQWLWMTPKLESAEPKNLAALAYEIPQARATVYFDLAGTRYEWSGHLDRYDGIGLDTQTRTIPCRVVVDDPRSVKKSGDDGGGISTGPPALLRGMYVTIEVQAAPNIPLWVVPKDAVRPGKILWLVRDGKLAKQSVRIVQTLEDGVAIHAAGAKLSTADRVVVSPLAYPYEGRPVREAGSEEEASSDTKAATGKQGGADTNPGKEKGPPPSESEPEAKPANVPSSTEPSSSEGTQ